MGQPIILPHGGYQQLKSYKKSVIVFDGTCCFARRFIKSGDRTCDQMIQAARSGKQNIVEGSMASAVGGAAGGRRRSCPNVTIIGA